MSINQSVRVLRPGHEFNGRLITLSAIGPDLKLRQERWCFRENAEGNAEMPLFSLRLQPAELADFILPQKIMLKISFRSALKIYNNKSKKIIIQDKHLTGE